MGSSLMPNPRSDVQIHHRIGESPGESPDGIDGLRADRYTLVTHHRVSNADEGAGLPKPGYSGDNLDRMVSTLIFHLDLSVLGDDEFWSESVKKRISTGCWLV